MSLSAAPPPPAPVHPSSFHFAKSSVEPVTAQWTAREPKQKHDRTSSGGGGIKQLFGRKLVKPSSRSPSPSPAADMYAQMFPQNNASQSQPFPQQQPQQQPFPSSAHTSSHGHGARGAFDPEFDDYERQLDYETDANTSYNAAKLSANLRQPSAPSPNQRPRTKSKSSKGKDRERSSSESRARRQAVMDKARRERRRAGQLDSDTTQGEDTDSDEYVTGYGNTKPVAGMFGSAGAVGAGGAGAGGGGGGPRGHAKSNSASMPTLPPTSAHPYVSNTYASPTNAYGGYAYAQAQPNPYAQAPGQQPHGAQAPPPGSANPYATPFTPTSYFSPTAPTSAQFPNLFAQTNPPKNYAMNPPSDSTARHFAEAATKYGADAATAYATEAAVRHRLMNNPLPGLPGSGAGRGGGGGDGGAGMPGLSGAAPGGMPGMGGGMPGMGGGMPGMGGMPGGGGMHGMGGMPGLAGGGGGMPGLGGGMPVGGGTLPGGYGGQPSRSKSKSKAHAKSASTSTLPAQHAQGYPPSHYPPTRTTKTSDPPPAIPSKGRTSREQGRGRSDERERERSRSRSRPRPGWDTAESLLAERDGPRGGAPNGGHGTRILNGGRDGGPAMFNGVPVVNAGPPQLERVPSRSKWGKITGLFTRGRRGSSASQQETGYGAPPPMVVRDPRDAGPPPVAKTHKGGLRNLSFDRLRRGPSTSAAPPPAPPLAGHFPPRGTGPDIGMPPGTVPVGIHVDRYGKIVEPPLEDLAPRARVPGFRPGRGGTDEKAEGPIRLDPHGRRTSSDAGYTNVGMGGMGMGGIGMTRRTSSDAPMPGYAIGMGGAPPLGGRRPSMDRQGSSLEGRRPSFDGPDAYRPAPRHRAGSSSSQPPPPLMGTIGTDGMPGLGDGYGGPGGGGFGAAKSPAIGMGMPPLGAMKSPAGLKRHGSWEARSPASGLVSPHTPRGMPSPHIFKGMPSPHIPNATPRYGPSVADSIMSPRMEDGSATPYTHPGRYEAAGATPYMRERDNALGTPRAPSITTTLPRTLPRPRTADFDRSPTETPSPDVTEADVARAAQHREAFEWAEQDAKDRVALGDDGAPYIFNGFPTWLNWDLFTRLENTERQKNEERLLPRVSSDTRPEMLKLIYEEWHNVRDKWVDRFWDPRWAVFMREVGGPIQKQLAEERQTPEGRSLEAARVYQRENSELPLAKREFSRGYLWDEGYMHQDWWWIPEKAWHWAVEHENDERRARGRAPLPRYYPGMSADDWRDVRDVWHTTASKWAEKRKDTEWLARDKREGVTPERRKQLEQQFLRSRQQHKVIRKASGQRSREALRPEERDKIRHDSAMEHLARKQEAYKQAQAVGTPRISEAERRRQAQREMEELMRTPAMTHPRPASSIGHASTRRGEGSIHHGGSSVGHAGPARDAWGNRMPGEPDEDSDPYDSTSSEDQPPVGINPYTRAPNGFPPPPPPEPLPEWMRREKTSDPPSSSMQSVPGRNPSVPSVSKTKKPGILKGILKRTLSIQRNNNNKEATLGRTNSRRNGQATQNAFAGMFGNSQSRNEVSPVDNPWAGVFRSAHPVAVQPIRFDRDHPFSMTSPHALNYEGKLYPSAIHLWHAMRFLRRPVGRGRGRTEESFHPELSESIRKASEPELRADQWAHAGAIGKDGTIMRSLQRPDWEEVQMEKMDEVLALKFTQHPRLGEMLVSTNPAELLYMWDGPWGAGADLRGPNNLGKAVMRCRERLLQYRGR